MQTLILNNGLMDQWNIARTAGYGLAYFERSDLPYYYELADAFMFGSTLSISMTIDRMLFSGSITICGIVKKEAVQPMNVMMLINGTNQVGWRPWQKHWKT